MSGLSYFPRMKKLILLLNICSVVVSFSQTKTHYDCSFSYENKKGCHYTLMTTLNNCVRIDYYNCLNKIIKTEHYTNKYDIDKDHLNGLQILYNYDGSIYSSGNFTLGQKDGLWETNFRDTTKELETFQAGSLLKSIRLKSNNDTSSISYYEINTKKNRQLTKISFAEGGKRNKIALYGYSGKDSIVRYIENGSFVKIVDYKDSFKTENNTTKTDNDESLSGPVEKMPEFKGGHDSFTYYIEENLVYPEQVADNEICGTIRIFFVIDTDGSVKNVHVSDAAPAQNPEFEKEALRLMEKTSGMWEPGRQNGVPVKVLCIVPIYFTIED